MNYHRGACTPRALAYVLQEPFEQVCHRIHAVPGGDHQSVTGAVMHAVLGAAFCIRKVQEIVRRRPPFDAWRKHKRGNWVVVVTQPGRNGHCVVLQEGAARDNGWMTMSGAGRDFVVCAAWQLGNRL
jgi:hypothetical protein